MSKMQKCTLKLLRSRMVNSARPFSTSSSRLMESKEKLEEVAMQQHSKSQSFLTQTRKLSLTMRPKKMSFWEKQNLKREAGERDLAHAPLFWDFDQDLIEGEGKWQINELVEGEISSCGKDHYNVTLKLNITERKNAISIELLETLLDTMEWLTHHKEKIRALFLEANGDVFCAGGDIRELRNYNNESAKRLATFLRRWNSLPMLTVAVVQGPCYGGGVGLLTACDYVVCVNNDIKFCFSEVKIGMIPATISPYVVRKIGYAATRSLFLTAKMFDVTEAKHLGLVNEVVEGWSAEQKQQFVERTVLPCGPEAVMKCKSLVESVTKRILDTDYLYEYTAVQLAELRKSEEVAVGAEAVLNKRRPPWSAK